MSHLNKEPLGRIPCLGHPPSFNKHLLFPFCYSCLLNNLLLAFRRFKKILSIFLLQSLCNISILFTFGEISLGFNFNPIPYKSGKTEKLLLKVMPEDRYAFIKPKKTEKLLLKVMLEDRY